MNKEKQKGISNIRFETNKQLLNREKDYCILCKERFKEETEKQIIIRMMTRGNFCSKCNNKCNVNSKIK